MSTIKNPRAEDFKRQLNIVVGKPILLNEKATTCYRITGPEELHNFAKLVFTNSPRAIDEDVKTLFESMNQPLHIAVVEKLFESFSVNIKGIYVTRFLEPIENSRKKKAIYALLCA